LQLTDGRLRRPPLNGTSFGGLLQLRRTERGGVRRSVASAALVLYGECMARLTSTTVRLEEDDIRALKKARAAGHSASELVRKGLRVVATRYYSGRRPPTTGLFESTDSKLGDESLLFKDLKD
jgi:hypothetical protein